MGQIVKKLAEYGTETSDTQRKTTSKEGLHSTHDHKGAVSPTKSALQWL